MYGTCAKMPVKPENRPQLMQLMDSQDYPAVPGFMGSYVLAENEGDDCWVLAIFSDREAYERNADDPAQHERYLAYRDLLEAEPEWHDGEILASG